MQTNKAVFVRKAKGRAGRQGGCIYKLNPPLQRDGKQDVEYVLASSIPAEIACDILYFPPDARVYALTKIEEDVFKGWEDVLYKAEKELSHQQILAKIGYRLEK